MLAEKSRSIQLMGSADFLSRSNIAFDSEKQSLERTVGIDLTSIIVSNLNLGLLGSLPKRSNELLSVLPLYPKLRTLDRFMKPEEEVTLFTRVFASALTESWNVTDTRNLGEKEKRLSEHCSALRKKGYKIRQVIDYVSKHLSIPIYPDFFLYSIKDVTKATGITNRRKLQHEMEFAMARDENIVPQDKSERKKGKRILFKGSTFYKLISSINSKREPILLPENNKPIEVNGEIRRKILKQLLESYRQGKPVPMHELLSNYRDGKESSIDKKRYRVLKHLEDLREILKDYGWTIRNARNHGHRFRGKESLYSLVPYNMSSDQIETTSSPKQIETRKNPKEVEVVVFEPKDVQPEFDPKFYSTPKGEKAFYNLTDIAKDLGADKSDVRKALAKMGIRDLKGKSNYGGKKDEMRFSNPEYRIIKDSLQQEVRRKKKKKREATSSPVILFQEGKDPF